MFPGNLQHGKKPSAPLTSAEERWWERVVRADSEQRQRTIKRTEETRAAKGKASGANIAKKGEKLKEDMDRIIEEIDEVLEENAEDFVRNYIQRGGQ